MSEIPAPAPGHQSPATRDTRFLRGITVVVAAACCVLAFVLPSVYFLLARDHEETHLRIETELRGRAVNALISRHPEMWKYQHNELSTILDERFSNNSHFSIHIVDLQGSAVAELRRELAGPLVKLTTPLYDTGLVVGRVEVVGSLRPLLTKTLLAALTGIVLAIAIFWVVNVVPLTSLRRALADLREQTVRAERANAAKSTFLAGMSHEIRTPMNGVIGMTSLLLGTPLNREQHEYVETIRTSGNALLGVINDVLDFSKIESGSVDLESQAFEVARCVEDVFGIVASAAAKKRLDLLYLVESDVPSWVEGDVARLRQVLVNLVNNGIKFTERGEIFIHVSALARDTAQPVLRFAVRDTGIGIPQARQAELFQPFYQVDASAARKHEGTGLGLAICVRLVTLMDGAISVESAPGSGSTFSFTIPAKTTQAVAVRFSQSDQFAIQGKRVLVVDDNDTSLRVLDTVMRRWGLACDTASSPGQALAMLRASSAYNVAILDYQMPEMTGVELAREIRRLEGCAALPLVLFSSVDLPGAPRAGDDALFQARLFKPLRQSQLFDTLIGVFGGAPLPLRKSAANIVGAAERERRGRVRLLVAEDNAINIRLIMVMLEKLGYRADMAADGVEALAALKRRTYDVILMDVQMPEMDGVEATRRIRGGFPAHAQPYIIAVTANVMYGDRHRYVDAGMNAFLPKPFTTEELEAALSTAAGAHLAGANPAAQPSAVAANERATLLLDRERIDEIRHLEHATKRDDVLSGFVRTLEGSLAGFDAAFSDYIARGDTTGAARAAHTLKGTCHQLGAQALGDLFADIERSAKVGDYAEAKRRLDGGASLIAQSLEALKHA